MKKFFSRFTAVVIVAGILFSSCNKNNDQPGNEEELITTLRVSLYKSGSSTPMVFEFSDPDGNGGNPPVRFDTIRVDAGSSYTCGLQVLDESKTPAVDITPEVIAEGTAHQFYYQPTGVSIIVQNVNTDIKNYPLGNTSTWTTAPATEGFMKITLKHKPGIKTANDDISIGETDVEVNFPAVVQ